MIMFIFVGACVACLALGYIAGRRNDRVDIHREPARSTEPPPFEAAIERMTEPEPVVAQPPDELKARRTRKRKPRGKR